MSANVSADQGAVAAGRDVVADLIVTGDQNTFFVGAHQRLADAYIDPREVLERVDVAHFVGRRDVIAALDEFLAAQPCGYLVVEAPAGLGKTALLAHLVATRGWIHHFSELAPGEAGIAAARMSLAAQLIRAYDLRDGADTVLSEAAAARVDFLRGLLGDAAARLGPGEKLVVVVDALDEAGTRPGENVLGLPRVLPDGVYMVVSKRPVPVDLYTESPRRIVAIEPGSEANLADVRAYLAEVAPPALVEPLLDRSGGLWIYVHYALLEGPGLDPDALPDGLWAWYHRFWQTWARTHPTEWHGVHLPLLAALAAARESPTLPELAAWAGIDPPPPELPPEWRPYLIAGRERPRRYRLYHASLEDYLHGLGTTDDTAEQDFADDLADATQAAHGRIADLCRAAPEPDAYTLAHLPAHLRLAGRPDELFALVDDPGWRATQLLRDPGGGGYLSTITEGWDCAVALDRRALEEGEAPTYLQREITCALAAGDVRSVAAYLPVELLARLVGAGIWTPQQALASAVLSPYPYGRAMDLAVVLPHLPEAQRAMELQAFFAWAAHDRARSLDVLAEHVPAELMQTALGFAAGIEDDGDRAGALGTLAAYLPAAQRAAAVDVALGVESAEYRVQALTALLPELDGDLRDTAVAAALDALVPADRGVAGEWMGRLVAGLAGDVPPERLLAIASSFEDHDARAHAIIALGDRLDPDVAASALAAVIVSDWRVIEVLAPVLPESLVPDAVAAARAIPEPDDRTRALVALAPRVPVEDRAEALSAAPDPDSLARAIAGLAPVLDHAQLGGAFASATALEEASLRAWTIAQLHPHLPADLQAEARAALEGIEDSEVRDRALGWLQLDAHAAGAEDDAGDPVAIDPAELAEALAEAAAEGDAAERAHSLAPLIRFVPDGMLLDALRVATAPLDTDERAELWALLAAPPPPPGPDPDADPPPPPLARDARAGAIAAALAHDDALDRARALADACARIPPAERPSELIAALAPTLDEAAATLGSRAQSRVVRLLAPYLPDALLPHAFAMASRIRRDRRRKYAIQDMSADVRTRSPAVLHACLDVALRGSVEQLETTRCVRWLQPIVTALDRGGVPWKPS